MRADDEAHFAVEEVPHRLNLGRRLRVKVDDDRIRLLAERSGADRGFHGAERVVDRPHEHPPLGIDDKNAPSIAGLDEIGAAPGRPFRHVDRPKERRLAGDVALRIALVERVVAQRHHVGAGRADIVEMPLRQTAAVTGILAVHDDEVEAEALDQPR